MEGRGWIIPIWIKTENQKLKKSLKKESENYPRSVNTTKKLRAAYIFMIAHLLHKKWIKYHPRKNWSCVPSGLNLADKTTTTTTTTQRISKNIFKNIYTTTRKKRWFCCERQYSLNHAGIAHLLRSIHIFTLKFRLGKVNLFQAANL